MVILQDSKQQELQVKLVAALRQPWEEVNPQTNDVAGITCLQKDKSRRVFQVDVLENATEIRDWIQPPAKAPVKVQKVS